MDWFKRASGMVVVALIGLALIVAALSKALTIGPATLTPSSSPPLRWALGAVGGLVLVIAAVMWRHSGDNAEPGPATGRVELAGLDELPGLESSIKGARRLSILTRTGINLLSSYEGALTAATGEGCEVRFVFVDPAKPAARHLYGQNYEMYQNNVRTAVAKLQHLRSALGPRLTAKVMSDAPPFSLVIVEYREKPGEARVQLNFLHTRLGRDRPVITLAEENAWFAAFLEEFDAIWHHATEFDRVT